jgi:hypothetical protein
LNARGKKTKRLLAAGRTNTPPPHPLSPKCFVTAKVINKLLSFQHKFFACTLTSFECLLSLLFLLAKSLPKREIEYCNTFSGLALSVPNNYSIFKNPLWQ